MVLLGLMVAAPVASAQSLGTFTWQLQPFCNRVTVSVTQNGGVYTLDGFDDQCGASQRAPLVGLAAPNPDGSIGLGFHIATVPGGRTVSVESRISLATIGGPWTDSAGNSGTLVLGGQAAGAARPVPPSPGVTVNSVTSTSIVDGSIGAADINTAQVQRRLTGECPRGQYMTYIYADGAPICTPVVGVSNTALGLFALQSVVGVSGNNTALGNAALRDLSTGNNNVAVGQGALLQTTSGQQNVAVGGTAMAGNLTGFSNVVVGQSALGASTGGAQNVVIGALAMQSATASSNIAIGYQAGANITAGSNNILVGSAGVAGDSNRLRLGTSGVQTTAFIAGVRGVTTATAAIPVYVGTDGQLGTVSSSRRFKSDVADMGDFSARLAALRPVTFRYTQPAADGSRPLDYGLIAEEVAEVFPELAVRAADGQIETVAYHKLPALLLNELQKQQRALDALQQELATLRAVVASAPKR